MKVIGFKKSHPIKHKDSLIEFEIEMPKLKEHDLLIKVEATSVNPVDVKIRMHAAPKGDHPKILGYDAVGIIKEISEKATNFSIGDRVYYSGDLTRDGSNAEYQVVDSRIVAKAPKSLNDPEAAALPLTTLTAWEAFFDRLQIDSKEKGTLLIIGGAGGVGSIAIQIAKAMTHLTVIATASRKETEAWIKKMGADYTANHRDLVNSVNKIGFETVDYIFNAADTAGHWDAMVELIKPQGKICCIVESPVDINLSKLQNKSATFVWELMFTRPMFNTNDVGKQAEILSDVAHLVDSGKIQTTLTKTIKGFKVDTLKEAHQYIESGKTIGKIAIDY